jgi:hypothetical protein
MMDLGKTYVGMDGKKYAQSLCDQANETSRKYFYFVKPGENMPWFKEQGCWTISRRPKKGDE